MPPRATNCLNLVTFAPYELAEGDWDSLKEQHLENQLDLLEKKFGLDVRDHITVARVNTPFVPFTTPDGASFQTCVWPAVPPPPNAPSRYVSPSLTVVPPPMGADITTLVSTSVP